MRNIDWCAIGDSFTYLNDHLDETDYRVTKGYLTRVCEKIPGLQYKNIGINGSTTEDWLEVEIPEADFYTILLGTNDWAHEIPLGSEADFREKRSGTILGNLAVILEKVRSVSPQAEILVLNPVERADFVYIFNPVENHCRGSYRQAGGQWLKDIAMGIYDICVKNGIDVLDLYHLSGFTQENLVRFKQVKTVNGYEKLSYPDYIDFGEDYMEGEQPYPPEAIGMTYDGLHPSDMGNEIIAKCLAEKMKEMM